MSVTPRWWSLSGIQELGLLGVIALLVAVLTLCGGSVSQPRKDPVTGEKYVVIKNRFLNGEQLVSLAKNTSFFAIMAIGATIIIVAGGIDLSVAGIYVLASLAGATLLNYWGPGKPAPPYWVVIPATVGLCAASGMLCGLINGLGVVGLKLHPFIITLGTMSIFRGLAFVVTKGRSIGGFNETFTTGFIDRRMAFGGEFISPVPLCILVLVGLWGTFFLARSVTGRKLHALGGNELAARYAGLAVNRLKVLTYVLAGLMAGIAAMINIGVYGSAASGDGEGYELEVIAAAVVGGASLTGGRGTALGAVLGALILRLIATGIVILDLDQKYSQIIIGLVIVIAATIDRMLASTREMRT